MIRIVFALAVAFAPLPAAAEGEEFGTLNPDEMTLKGVIDKLRDGKVDMTSCAAGYMMTKSGRHALARETFLACAEAGYTGAMTWLSQLDNNGLGGAYDPDAAAEWDRRAAELGDPVGMFNYGLDLLRGHGVPRDAEAGRAMIDQAADAGLAIAKRLQGADYDLDEVTPDADNWKYAPVS